MEAKACAKHIRISPRKARQVVDLIRGKSVQEAYSILKFTPHKGSAIVTKVLKSAVANAEHNYDMDAENLYAPHMLIRAQASSATNHARMAVPTVSKREPAISPSW